MTKRRTKKSVVLLSNRGKKLLTDMKAKALNVFFALVLIRKVNNEKGTRIINTKNKIMMSIKKYRQIRLQST